MDQLLAIQAFIMGLVEGFTEFLPISSTGHLILAGSLLKFTGEKVKVFEIVIQAAALLAVVWEYRVKIAQTLTGMFSDDKARRFAINVVIGFLPAALLGVLLSRKIKDYLFKPVPVALAFIIGGFIIFWVENRQKAKEVQGLTARITNVDQMTMIDALKVGFAQTLALIPGTSRSGATIIGGMMLGLSRQVATEFSFFLAIPTLIGATVYSLYKERALLSAADLPMFGVGSLAAFISAFLCVRWLLRYISSH
ncbi:MAG: undecaprenyl-diphosphate phosphatase, partial [Burkholderiales bacterium]|nr:undecaprenyl-diphosphate phosphatase [Burkholderiales bacterium]